MTLGLRKGWNILWLSLETSSLWALLAWFNTVIWVSRMAPGKQQIFQACLRNDGLPKRMPRISLRIFPSTKHGPGKDCYFPRLCDEVPDGSALSGLIVEKETVCHISWLKWLGGSRACSSLLLHLCWWRKQGGEEEAASVSHIQVYPFGPSSTYDQKTPLLAGHQIVQKQSCGGHFIFKP